MVAVDPSGEPLWRCTGSLLSEDLFLTAGHCVGEPEADPADQPDTVYIWFTNKVINTDPQYIKNLEYEAEHGDDSINLCLGTPDPNDAYRPVSGYPCGGYDAWGQPESYEEWTGALTIPQTYDVGVVHDLHWVGTIPSEFGTIADIGTVQELAESTGKGNIEFTVVGFGLQSVKPVESAIKQRMIGTVSFVNLQSALTCEKGSQFVNNPNCWNLHYSNNPGQGHGGSGGTCFGDSGGPVLYQGEIVAVNSFVLNSNCNGAGFGYRVDTELVYDFLADFGYTP
jgi:hypothetical protein